MTSWFPLGPDFVFGPRNVPFERLSRHNELGRQCSIYDFAIDQTNPNWIYAVLRPWVNSDSPYQANALFRSGDSGLSWIPIGDELHQANPLVDFRSVAVDPVNPATIYVGTSWNGSIYISTNRGAPGSWLTPRSVPARLGKIVLDPRTAGDPSTAVVYAPSDSGLYMVPPAGAPSAVLAGNIWYNVAFTFPTPGAPRCFAAVANTGGSAPLGLFYSNDPATPSSWINLSDGTHGLPTPASVAGFFSFVPAICRINPDRVYALALQENAFAGLYSLTDSDPATGIWTPVSIAAPPGIDDGPGFLFDVASNSVGDAKDILFVGSRNLWRSTNAGKTWAVARFYYADHHAIGFVPDPSPGKIPVAFYSCDGGIGSSTGLCDPAFDVDSPLNDFGEGATLSPQSTEEVANLDHGLHAAAIYSYACDPSAGAIGYIGSQDTGTAASSGGLVWRAMGAGDIGALACVRGPSGMTIWTGGGSYGGFPNWATHVITDTGDQEDYTTQASATMGGSTLGMASVYVVDASNSCLGGCDYWDLGKTLLTTISAMPSTNQQATASSATGIAVGRQILVDGEQVTIKAANGATFTAQFSQGHNAGVPIRARFNYVFRIDQAANGSAISQDFSLSHDQVVLVAANVNAPHMIACVTSDNLLWMTDGTTANVGTVWTPVPLALPAGAVIGSLAVDASGNIYVGLTAPATIGAVSGAFLIVSGGTAVLQTSPTLPALYPYGRLIVDPVAANTLYLVHGGGVFQLTPSGAPHDWLSNDLSAGLPGAWVNDLWIGNIGSAASPRVMLRAGIAARGVWEREITSGATEQPSVLDLYVRDNILDYGRIIPSPNGAINPYQPNQRVWHFQCADIKVDAQQHPSGTASFFQATPPLDHDQFGELQDNSRALPPGDQAYLHVQVHNRSNMPAKKVWVWALYTHFSAGLAALDATVSNTPFDFWGQFDPTGVINPTLTSDNKWQAIGPPELLGDLDAAHPGVASWLWTVPSLMAGDSGHYCVAAFVHSANALLSPMSTNIDLITSLNKQIGQKNLQLVVLGKSSKGPKGVGGSLIIRFSNPTTTERVATLVFDQRALPKQLRLEVQLSKVDLLTQFLPAVHKLKPATLATIGRVLLPPRATVAARIVIREAGWMPPGREWRLDILQQVEGVKVGGASVIIRTPGRRLPVKNSLRPSEHDLEYGEGPWQEGRAQLQRHLPRWLPGARFKME